MLQSLTDLNEFVFGPCTLKFQHLILVLQALNQIQFSALKTQLEQAEQQTIIVTQEFQKLLREKQGEYDRLNAKYEDSKSKHSEQLAQFTTKYNDLAREEEKKKDHLKQDLQEKIDQLQKKVNEKDKAIEHLEKQVTRLVEVARWSP